MEKLLETLATAGMDVISVLVQITIFTVGVFVLRFVKAKFGTQVAKVIVSSVEQTASGIAGEDKKQIVADVLKKKLGFLFKDSDINHLIEAAVYELKQLPGLNNFVNNTGPIIEKPKETNEEVSTDQRQNISNTMVDETPQVTAGQ